MLAEQRFIAHFIDGSTPKVMSGVVVFGILRATYIELGMSDEKIEYDLGRLFTALDNDDDTAKQYIQYFGLEYIGKQHLNLIQ